MSCSHRFRRTEFVDKDCPCPQRPLRVHRLRHQTVDGGLLANNDDADMLHYPVRGPPKGYKYRWNSSFGQGGGLTLMSSCCACLTT